MNGHLYIMLIMISTFRRVIIQNIMLLGLGGERAWGWVCAMTNKIKNRRTFLTWCVSVFPAYKECRGDHPGFFPLKLQMILW